MEWIGLIVGSLIGALIVALVLQLSFKLVNGEAPDYGTAYKASFFPLLINDFISRLLLDMIDGVNTRFIIGIVIALILWSLSISIFIDTNIVKAILVTVIMVILSWLILLIMAMLLGVLSG